VRARAQFGPNCTTWLVAAEVFPTDVRTTFQGTSAAAGKVGAIIADVVFGYVDQRTTFYLSGVFGLVGAAVTWLFLPDTTGMSLDELDRCVPAVRVLWVCVCCAVLCCAVLCCAVLCCAVLCCAVLCCAVLCCVCGVCSVMCWRRWMCSWCGGVAHRSCCAAHPPCSCCACAPVSQDGQVHGGQGV
jgi:hypothetical protein